MQDLQDAVVVVTGGASGIGLAMAEAFGSEGAKLVLADIEGDALERACDGLEAQGVQASGVRTDVSSRADVEGLLDATLARYGKVNVLCNNAGVQVAGPTWQMSPGEWEWVLGVNLWGVIHGVSVFVPQMLQQGDACHLVNTSSMSGLVSVPMMSAYQVTKHAVVTLSESLTQELKQQNAAIGVSVLCPAFVQTKLHEAERNRPDALKDPSLQDAAIQDAIKQGVHSLIRGGKPASEIASAVVQAVRDDAFYVITHPEMMPAFKARVDRIFAAAKQ